MDLTALLNKLGEMRTVFDYGPVLTALINNGTIAILCRLGVWLVPLALLIRTVQNSLSFSRDLLEKTLISFALAALVAAFEIPAVYAHLVGSVLNAFQSLGEGLQGPTLAQFQSELRFSLAAASEASALGVGFLNPPFMTSPMDALMVALVFQGILVVFYLLLSFSPFLAVFAFALGPVCLPLALIRGFQGIVVRYLNFIFGSCLLSVVVTLALQLLLDMGLVRGFADFGYDGLLFASLLFGALTISAMLMSFALAAQLFGLPVLALPAKVFGLILACFGLFPVLLKVMLLTSSRFSRR